MARALELAGLDKTGTFYALRHSYISRAIEGEVPLNIIGDNCGTSVRMIEKTYAKILAYKRREFIERGAPSLLYWGQWRRGLVLRPWAIFSRSRREYGLRSTHFGRYCRTRPLVFSLVGRCHGLCRSQK
jgi:hypothetical protein